MMAYTRDSKFQISNPRILSKLCKNKLNIALIALFAATYAGALSARTAGNSAKNLVLLAREAY